MASAAEKLANSLEELERLQKDGRVAIRSSDISRTHRERLLKTGFLTEVMKGWYIASDPADSPGESTAWYTSFWGFCAQYLTERFGDDWSLSPEQSLVLTSGNTSVPSQLLVRAPRARNKRTDLPHGTSIFESRTNIADGDSLLIEKGLRLFAIEDALISVRTPFFQQWATEARTVLAIMSDASALLAKLLDGSHIRAAGRLAGAFRSVGQTKIADEILAVMKSTSHNVRETNPFDADLEVEDAGRIRSPHVHRIRLKWERMQTGIIDTLPPPKPLPKDIDVHLAQMDEIYVTDAYHSLSIEGYRVSTELIERVRSANWNPDQYAEDGSLRDVLAARGYWEAFQNVRKSVRSILEGEDAGEVADRDLETWYRALFAPSVKAEMLRESQLFGYRSAPVFIRQSQHVPMSAEAVRECMPVFFDLLKAETDARVRIVLGHFILVFIHPYLDGNGRIARFLMNVMMASAGHPWLVIKVDDRNAYMAALEEASVEGNIEPFAEFMGGQMTRQDRDRA